VANLKSSPLAMEAARITRPPALADLVRVGLIGVLLLLALVAWLVTDERMQGMDTGPGTDLGNLGFYVGVWVVMMAAMMFPSIWPMVLMYRRVQTGKRERGGDVPAGATAVFVAGYLVTWTCAGLVGYAVIDIVRSLSIEALSWDEAGPYVAGGVIFAAAVYQLTPLKDACLTKCRGPLAFVLHSWRPGRVGALRMGIEHGAWCVGCCWALMAALFALGVMSIGWMAFIAALIALEKLLPWKRVANYGIAVLLAVLGLAVAFAPEDVPGLTLPDSPEAVEAMEAMGMEGPAPSSEDSMGMEGPASSTEGSMGTEDSTMDPGEESMGTQAPAMKPGGAGMNEER
jgi:predicted metal-binding membrane protein